MGAQETAVEEVLRAAAAEVSTSSAKRHLRLFRHTLPPLLAKASESPSDAASLVDLIFQTLPIYDDRASQKAVDDMVIQALGEPTFMKPFAAVLVQSMEKNLKVTNPLTSFKLLRWSHYLLKWSKCATLSKGAFSRLANAQAVLCQVPMNGFYRQCRIGKQLSIHIFSEPSGMYKMYIEEVRDLRISMRDSPAFLNLILDFIITSPSLTAEYKSMFLDLYVKIILSSKGRPPKAATEAFKPLFVEIGHEDFKNTVMLSCIKMLKRNPEIVLQSIGYLLKCYKDDGIEEVKLAILSALETQILVSAEAVQPDIVSFIAAGLKERKTLRKGHLKLLRVACKKSDSLTEETACSVVPEKTEKRGSSVTGKRKYGKPAKKIAPVDKTKTAEEARELLLKEESSVLMKVGQVQKNLSLMLDSVGKLAVSNPIFTHGQLPSLGKGYAKMILWALCFITFFKNGVARVGNVQCDHLYLTKRIKGHCLNSHHPNGICCLSVANAIERGQNVPCLCNILKAGVKAEKIIRIYYRCGGKSPLAAQLISLCGGAPPPPAEGDWRPPPHPRSGGIVIAVIVCCTVAGLFCWLLYKLWKRKSQRQIAHHQVGIQLTTIGESEHVPEHHPIEREQELRKQFIEKMPDQRTGPKEVEIPEPPEQSVKRLIENTPDMRPARKDVKKSEALGTDVKVLVENTRMRNGIGEPKPVSACLTKKNWGRTVTPPLMIC